MSFDPTQVTTLDLQSVYNLYAGVLQSISDLSTPATIPDISSLSYSDIAINVNYLAEIAELTANGIDSTLPDLADTSSISDISLLMDTPFFGAAVPILSFLAPPDLTAPAAPTTGPTLDTITIPNPPVWNQPTAPNLLDVVIPTASFAMPQFQGVKPIDTISLPAGFAYRENYYQSWVKATLQPLLLNALTTATGYSPAAEQAMVDGDKDTEILQLRQEIDDIMDEDSASGFPRPGGSAAMAVTRKILAYTNRHMDASDETAAKALELEQKNIQAAMTQIIALDRQYMSYAGEIAQRLLQGAIYKSDAATKLFDGMIARYKVNLELWSADAQVYASTLKGWQLVAEFFKAQVEAVGVAISANDPKIKLYLASLSAIESTLKMYEIQLEGVTLNLDVDRMRIEAFQSTLQAYNAQVSGVTAQFTARESIISGQVAQAEAYVSRARADLSIAEAAKTQAQAQVESNRVSIENAKNISERNVLVMQSYMATIDLAVSLVREQAKLKNFDTELYKAITGELLTEIEKTIKEAQQASANAANSLHIQTQEYEAAIISQKNSAELMSEADLSAKGIVGQIQASKASVEHYTTADHMTTHNEHLNGAERIGLLTSEYINLSSA